MEYQLYDLVNAWTFEKPKNIGLTLPTHSLSVDFVDLVCNMCQNIEKVEYWCNLARLPYPTMWMEVDGHEKVKSMNRHGNLIEPIDLDNVPTRLGYLFQELDASSGAWSMTSFLSDWVDKTGKPNENSVGIDCITWFFAPEGTSVRMAKLALPYKSLHDNFPDVLPKGIEAVGIGLQAAIGTSKAVAMTPWIENRLQVAIEPLYQIAMDEFIKNNGNIVTLSNHMVKQTIYSLRENSGLIRFMITALALLNNAPNVKHIVSPKTGYQLRNFHKVPYLGHRTVELVIPKRKPIVHFTKLLKNASDERRKVRAHSVRGYFRQIEHGKPTIRCDHVPTLVENGLGICLKCERMIRWIPTHTRGDATLGWVQHDYNVNAR